MKKSGSASIALWIGLFGSSAGTIPLFSDPADYAINLTNGISGQTTTTLRTGANVNTPSGGRNAVFIFQLPALGTNVSLADAQLSFYVTGSHGANFNIDLWGIGFATNTNAITKYLAADTDSDSSDVKLQDNILTPASATNTTYTTTGTNLVSYLRSFYSAHPDYSGSGSYVFLRLNPDGNPGSGNAGFDIGSGNNPTSLPGLTLYTVSNPVSTNRPTRPNFLIMITDDQRWDALSLVQAELQASNRVARFPWFQTPNLDRLAGQGARFRNAFDTLALCSCSRAALLSGVYNHLNGVINNSTPFPSNTVTCATVLRDAGYYTGYIGKWHMGSQVNRPGFDYSASFIGQGVYNNCVFVLNGTQQVKATNWVDDATTAYATNFIYNNQDRSFLLFVGFKSPHDPRTPATRNQNLYATNLPNGSPNQNVLSPYQTSALSLTTNQIQNYFQCIQGVDQNVGSILQALDDTGLASNTVVIYLSDNGFYLNDHAQYDKRTAYDESLRVPFLLRYPKLVAPGTVLDQMLLNIDLAPTIIDLAGLAIPSIMQGRSTKPLLQGQSVAWRDAFCYEYFFENGYFGPTELAFRTLTNKLVVYPGHDAWLELFDLMADPYETNNLARDPAQAGVLADLTSRFNVCLDTMGLMLRTSAIQFSPGNPGTFTWLSHGGIGPRYQFESTTNFINWTPVQQFKMDPTNYINPVTSAIDSNFSASMLDADANGSHAFYRVKMIGDN